MVKARAAGYELTIKEVENFNKHPLHNEKIFAIYKNDYCLQIGNLTKLINLHKKIKMLLEYHYVNNEEKDEFSLSYNSRYFYIKNKTTKAMIGIPNEFVQKLSKQIGGILYRLMVQAGKIKPIETKDTKKAPEQAK